MNELVIPTENNNDIIYKLVKGGIGAIPIAGSIIAETFGLIIAEPISKRREIWMNIVVEKLNYLESRNHGLITSLKENEEFISFILESSQIAFKTHQKEKLKVLQNTIENFFLDNSTEYDKKYSFLKVIEEITPTHLKILNFLIQNENYINENMAGFPQLHDKYSEMENIDKFYFRKCVIDLENQSLIRVSGDFADYFSGGGFSTDEGAPAIKILDFGIDFIKFITEK
ncbi:hypothetical protein [Flavobacterium restrictum]|uniref:Uncharacterized protein n=1 Tax=Flavobacterium restrictum TaxID=2594428 RepID=A0A553DH92_9FLAO|nr:hypothetical protein [Flavobacterium restrictum]TRX32083.1 hypothetical protein FNW21_16205 [Flavobacterium restrictum]